MKKKRIISAKQKAALAKGRKALAAKRISGTKRSKARKRSSVSAPSKSIIIHTDSLGGRKMVTRKKRRVSTVKKASRRRRSHRYYGASKISTNPFIAGIIRGVLGVGGAVGSSFIANKVPMPANIKPLLPVALGIGLGASKLARRSPLIGDLAIGMVIAGGIASVKQYLPQVQILAGEEELFGAPVLSQEEAALLGYDEPDDIENLLGAPEDYRGEEEIFVNPSDV